MGGRTKSNEEAASLGARRRGERGFSMLQLLVAMAVIVIVTTMALMATSKAGESLNLTGSTRQLASYLERARIDAITRRQNTSLSIDSSTGYTINLDADGSGTTETRTITLPAGVTLAVTDAVTGTAQSFPASITFDRRGRASLQRKITLSLAGSAQTTNVLMTGSGDITVNSNATGPATSTVITPTTTVSTTANITNIKGN